MRPIAALLAFLRNPAGWTRFLEISNEVRTPERDLVGEYVFRLERDRFGRRRCRVQVEGALPETTPKIIVGAAMARAWVRTGELPAAWRDQPPRERWTAKPGIVAYP